MCPHNKETRWFGFPSSVMSCGMWMAGRSPWRQQGRRKSKPVASVVWKKDNLSSNVHQEDGNIQVDIVDTV